MIELKQEGRRFYIMGNTYNAKDALKEAGCHWDRDKKAWWIGDSSKAEALKARIESPEFASPAVVASGTKVLGKVRYKGRQYLWLASSRDMLKYLVCFVDGTKQFWADASACEIVKQYHPREYRGFTEYMTFGELRRLQEAWRTKTQEEKADAGRVSQAGGRCRCARPLDEGDGECMCCGYAIVGG